MIIHITCRLLLWLVANEVQGDHVTAETRAEITFISHMYCTSSEGKNKVIYNLSMAVLFMCLVMLCCVSFYCVILCIQRGILYHDMLYAQVLIQS